MQRASQSPIWVQACLSFDYPLLLSKTHLQEIGLEVEQPGFEPMPIWDASPIVRRAAFSATVEARVWYLFLLW